LLAAGALVITACSNADSPTEPAVEAVTSDTGSGDSDSSDGSSDSGDSGDTTDTDVTGGSLQISMTDAPTDEICELVVFIEELRVKKDGSPPQILSPTDGLGGYDLILLQGGNEVSLGVFPVETGLYQFIEMLLDEDLSYVVEMIDPGDPDLGCESVESPLQIPSEKFKINGGPFEVGADTKVLIDFDADKSLTRKGNDKNDKGWMLKADVSIVEVVDPPS
jgi:hypothetical protein